MGPLDIASMLKQLSEVSRRRDVENKRRDREKIDSTRHLLNKDANQDVQIVNFDKNTIKPEGHSSFTPQGPSTSNKKIDEVEQPENIRLKEDYKANFLDISE